MCLVWLWKTGLWAMASALWLSQSSASVEKETWSSCNKAWTQVNSAEVWATLRYSASVLDLAVTYCFLDHQEPDVDLLSLISEAQSASHIAVSVKDCPAVAGLIWRQWNRVPLRYLRILFTVTQWESKGLATNWQTLFTTKLISGLVNVAYCKAPTTDLYKVGSWNRSLPLFESLQVVLWVMMRELSGRYLISMPKK